MQHGAQPGDSVITAYRDHGHMLACGMDPRGVMAELTGRRGGYSKGKGGSMHMFAREKNFYGGHGIVGAQVPLGTGLAFAHKYRERRRHQRHLPRRRRGQPGPGLREPSTWPRSGSCRSSTSSRTTSTAWAPRVERASARTELYKRGEAYGIPGEQVDGMDVLAVRAAAEQGGGARARRQGPDILEMKTYRYRGHSMSDPAKYRTQGGGRSRCASERDPIEQLRKTMLEGGLADEDDAARRSTRRSSEIVNEAAEFAQDSPEPDPAEL